MNRAVLESVGIDYADGLKRFINNQVFYEKFLDKFCDEPCITDVQTSFILKDYDKLLISAHTLKGISGNLSIMPIYELTSQMCQDLRSKTYDNLESLVEKLAEQFYKISEAIKYDVM